MEDFLKAIIMFLLDGKTFKKKVIVILQLLKLVAAIAFGSQVFNQLMPNSNFAFGWVSFWESFINGTALIWLVLFAFAYLILYDLTANLIWFIYNLRRPKRYEFPGEFKRFLRKFGRATLESTNRKISKDKWDFFLAEVPIRRMLLKLEDEIVGYIALVISILFQVSWHIDNKWFVLIPSFVVLLVLGPLPRVISVLIDTIQTMFEKEEDKLGEQAFDAKI